MSSRGSPPTAQGTSPLRPTKLSDFRMSGSIGAGATAEVFDAVHIATGRPVAIKVLEPSKSGSEMRERFAREALLVAGVVSRHVGAIMGFGFERGQPFLVLERLNGETLDAKLRRDGRVPPPIAVRWIEQLLVGVRDCHDRQIIHRDIKPSNIFLHESGLGETVKLIDFGVARVREAVGDTSGLTMTNHHIGSMGYMAPEQFFNAKAVGFTADIYAVGVVVFRTLSGRLPFVAPSLESVIKLKMERPSPRISSMPDMPENRLLDEFVVKTLARDPAARFQSAREMLQAWRCIAASIDDEASTDVMSASAAATFYAPPDPSVRSFSSPPSDASVAPAPDSSASLSPASPRDIPVEADPVYSAAAPSSGREVTLRAASASVEPSLPDLAAAPLDETAENETAENETEGAFEMTTRIDERLGEIVERERERSRAEHEPVPTHPSARTPRFSHGPVSREKTRGK